MYVVLTLLHPAWGDEQRPPSEDCAKSITHLVKQRTTAFTSCWSLWRCLRPNSRKSEPRFSEYTREEKRRSLGCLLVNYIPPDMKYDPTNDHQKTQQVQRFCTINFHAWMYVEIKKCEPSIWTPGTQGGFPYLYNFSNKNNSHRLSSTLDKLRLFLFIT